MKKAKKIKSSSITPINIKQLVMANNLLQHELILIGRLSKNGPAYVVELRKPLSNKQIINLLENCLDSFK